MESYDSGEEAEEDEAGLEEEVNEMETEMLEHMEPDDDDPGDLMENP